MMKKRLSNKGYSLIELLVIIAIMAVGLTVVSVSLLTIFSNQARQIGNSIDSMISTTKVNSTYRQPVVYLEIYVDGNNYKGRIFEKSSTDRADQLGTEEVLGPTRVPLQLNGFNTTSLPLYIAIDRGTGRMQEITDITSFTLTELTGRPNIRIGGPNSRLYEVELIPLTGNHSFGSVS